MLLPFFLETMIAEEGQDILRYDPSLNIEVKTRSYGDDIYEIYQKQLFAPLLDCMPSRFNSFHFDTCLVIEHDKDKLENILTGTLSPAEKWERIKELFDVILLE